MGTGLPHVEKEGDVKCSLCKTGSMVPGTATLTLERDETTLVIKDVPALVCDQCGDESFEAEAADRALEMLDEAVRRSVVIEMVHFARAEERVSAVG